MNEIVKFTSEQFGEIRVIEKEGEPWFCLADICKSLDLEQVSRVKVRLNADGVISSKVIDSLGRQQDANFINEQNLYKTVFQSRKESAEKFVDWITGEVLPSIRKTGGYIVGQDSLSEDALIEKALQVVARRMEERERQMKQKEEEKAQVEAKVVELQPKADYFDDLVERELLTNFRDTAKEFGLKQNQFIQMLEAHGYLYRTPAVKDKNGKKKKGQLKLVQRYVDDGLFEIKDIKGAYSHYAGNQTLITPKGKSVFQKLIPIWMKGE